MPRNNWSNDPQWKALNRYEKAAAMALLEADSANGRPDPGSAKNVLGAMINRADKEGTDLGAHVSKSIYQPMIEPAQRARLPKVLELPEFKTLTTMAEKRHSGELQDWVGGATHFLAHEPVMERLQAQDPQKYKSWVKWTGYEKNGQYANPDGSPVMRDRSHAFLAPEGAHSAHKPLTDVAEVSDVPGITVASADKPTSDPLMSNVRNMATRGSVAPTDAAAGATASENPTLIEVLTGGQIKSLKGSLDLGLGGAGKYQNTMASMLTPDASVPGVPQEPEQDDRAYQIAAAQRRRPVRGYGA